KDVCDIFALSWYSDEKPEGLLQKAAQFIGIQKIKGVNKIIKEEDYQKASVQLNHTPQEIKRVIELLR
ncbi:hypothetical protein HYV82_02615, partial [Candidatus Woesearchaeota archaeon]|nr:hypothetical protein [Candidatus Woesearchaeota archaeon]